MRLIDADALRNSFKDARDAIEKEHGTEREWITWNARLDTLDDVIWQIDNNFPTIEAEPVRHGRWEWHETWGDTSGHGWDEPYDAGWACSACGVDLMRYLQSHFSDIPSYAECASDEMPTVERCPNCGAKMDGGDGA